MSRLQGKIALITGAASGMGEAVVRRFRHEGAEVFAVGLQPEHLASLAVQTGAVATHCDVTDDASVRNTVAALKARFGRLDIVVNCAGVIRADDAADIDDATWHRTLDVNLTGAMRICRAALTLMQQQRSGVIVNVGSVAAFNGSPGMASYAASKAGLVALTRTIAHRYGPEGVRANYLAPGWVRTPMSENEMQQIAEAQNTSVESAFAAAAGRTALQRVGTVEEMAACVLFLASDESAFVTGAVLVADGGARIPATARAV